MTKNHGIERVSDPAAARYYEAASNMGAGLLNTSFQDADDIAEAVARPDRDIVKERIATEVQIQREIADGTGSITSIAVQAQRDSGLQARAEAEKKDKNRGIDITTQLIMLQQQAEQLQAEMGAIEEEVFSKEELAYLNGLPPEQRRDAAKDILDRKLANGEITPDQHRRWMDKDREIRDNAAKQEAAQQATNDFAARGVDAEVTVGVSRDAIEAYQQQHQSTKEQNTIAGVTTESEAATQLQERGELRSSIYESTDEAVEHFMKEAARIAQIEDPQERLLAEKAFVDKVRSLPAEIKEVGWEIEMADEAAHMFEEGYFDSLQTQIADVGTAAPSKGDHDLNRNNGQGNAPGNGLG
jgi:hypothetical protein